MSYIKIKSSTVLFGNYEYESFKSTSLKNDSLGLYIRKGVEHDTIHLQLSFKHIFKVELLDNSENKGAGLVIHVNNFMANKIQDALDKDGKEFSHFKSSYAPNRFIIMDIINCDKSSIMAIRQMLQQSENFHRNYVIQMYNKANISCQDVAQSFPVQYICTIHFNQWKSLLGSVQKDICFEYVEFKNEKYTIGKISNYVPTEVFSLQQDGSLISKRCDENSINVSSSVRRVLSQNINEQINNPIIKSYSASQASTAQFHNSEDVSIKQQINKVESSGNLISSTDSGICIRQNQSQQPIRYIFHSKQLSQQQPNLLNNGNIDSNLYGLNNVSASTPSNKLQPVRRIVQQQKASQKREIHIIEDEEEANNVSSSKKPNDTVFIYPATSGGHSCSVHYSDLKYLDHNFMLNDTIIDFYLKYIYHEFIPEIKRNKIFMFNSFFYSRLVQSPTHIRIPITMNTRLKKIQTNFQSIKSWTKRVNLFEKDYIIVPINEDIHWFLAVIINPRDGIIHQDQEMPTSSASINIDAAESKEETLFNDSKNIKNRLRSKKGPYVVIFDSLIENDRKHFIVKELLAEYLMLEFEDKRIPMSLSGQSFDKTLLKLITPIGMPQQKNYVDCGLFLLQFAEIFMINPPEKFSPMIPFSSWYPQFQIKGKRDAIKVLIKQMAPHVTYADFLPRPVTDKKNSSKKIGKKLLPNLESLMMQPIRMRRFSDSNILEIQKEAQFTSLGLNSLSRSFDSILNELKEMPPIVISFRDQLPKKRKSLINLMPNCLIRQ